MWNQAYNIRIINKDLLADIRHDLDAKDIQSGLDQVQPGPEAKATLPEIQVLSPQVTLTLQALQIPMA
ncbi:hypothetical protein M404DRAFT_36236 [Pisolithus tinctorius Marx 270]|uniref:Uncharacterized protein n=1 Tax=Pisolithus tinctorius Marx 270 TaxID=870435 RepID=A0A0C3J6E5_PISTI|nr:hypothetical protein M404DRAFT_36236 [Pisolithus tinctorius Marx 270]